MIHDWPDIVLNYIRNTVLEAFALPTRFHSMKQLKPGEPAALMCNYARTSYDGWEQAG